ncbi:MAG: hypothetical protein L0Z62_07135 [Gemmataceae bacterium]|nr:hypothetical protein [Gemmataceae bacterium]
MSHPRGQPAPQAAFSRTPLRPVPVPVVVGPAPAAPPSPYPLPLGGEGRVRGGTPLAQSTAVSWHAIGVGVAFCVLLLTGLVLAALALRPREAASLQAVAFGPPPPIELPALPAASAQPVQAEAEPGIPRQPGPSPFAVGLNGNRSPKALPESEPEEQLVKVPFVLKPGPANGEPAPCETYGTSVHFVSTPREASQRAAQEQKLVFTLHVSGNFEDPAFT